MNSIKEIKGNIFESKCKTLVNTVNCVGYMGKGIALEFKNRFPEMYESYLEVCEKELLKPGLLHFYNKSQPQILNFPTKFHYKFPSKLEYIDQGLQKFVSTYKKKGIESIAFPQLGSSLGGLNFQEVKELMYKHLLPLQDIQIEIYEFDPMAKDSLFENLCLKVSGFGFEGYKQKIGLKNKQAELIKNLIDEKKVHSMMEFQKVKGLGENSIAKLYDFARSEKSGSSSYVRETQLNLPF